MLFRVAGGVLNDSGSVSYVWARAEGCVGLVVLDFGDARKSWAWQTDDDRVT